jgi:multidrug efflux pump subunit AcrA (membrane-fusion protein)
VRFPVLTVARARAAGIATQVSVAPGDIVEAGTELLRINGRPVIAVNGSFPFWRDLSLGVAPGDDIRQLEEMLVSAGLNPGTVDTVFTTATHDALHLWQRAHGILPEDGTFSAGDTIVAGWPARIGGVRIGAGEDVAPGQEVLVLTAAAPEITVPITPVDRGRVREGLAARVESPDRTSDARVASLSEAPQADETGAETYEIVVELDDPEEIELVDGSFLRVEIVVREARNALAVPVAAIVLDGSGRQGVLVVGEDGEPEFRPITTGVAQGAYVQVKAGLDGTETVILGEQG